MEEWKEVPGHPAYKISSLGRLVGEFGLVKPYTHGRKIENTCYAMIYRNSYRRMKIRDMMYIVWDKELIPTKDWIDWVILTNKNDTNFVRKSKSAGKSTVKNVTNCCICGKEYERYSFDDWCCSKDCKKVKNNGAKNGDTKDPYDFKNFDKLNGMGWWSTQMLPLEWIDLPVAVRFRRGQRKQKIEVAA